MPKGNLIAAQIQNLMLRNLILWNLMPQGNLIAAQIRDLVLRNLIASQI